MDAQLPIHQLSNLLYQTQNEEHKNNFVTHKTSSLAYEYDFFILFLLNISVNIYNVSIKYLK